MHLELYALPENTRSVMQNRYLRLIVLQSTGRIGCLFDYGIYGLSEKYFILTVRNWGPSNY